MSKLPPMLFPVLGVTLLASACANQPESATDTLASGDPQQSERVVCEDVEVTGTRFPKRVCRTERVWEMTGDAQRAAAEEFGRQSRENAAVLMPVENRPEQGSPAVTFP